MARSYFNAILLVAVAGSLLIASPCTVAAEMQHVVGAAKVDITPAYPTLLSGYAARRAEPIHDVKQKLFARALAIGTDEQGPVVLVAIDNLGASASVSNAVGARLLKEHKIPRERFVVCATHTHNAPMLAGVANNLFVKDFNEREVAGLERYTSDLTEKIFQAAVTALKNRRPARLQWAIGSAQFAINRRDANGPVDHSLPVLRAIDADGKPIAILANYACHCVSVGNGMYFHGDWAGCAAEQIEADHPGATAIVVIGCGADQNPNAMNGIPSAEAHGAALAKEVKRVLAGPMRLLTAPLRGQLQNIELPLAELPTKAQWAETAKAAGIAGYHARKNLARLERGEALPTAVTYPVQTWAFGDELAMVFLGGEVVVDYARLLRQKFDFERLWVTAYSNDVGCYIPSERILREGRYEGGDAMVWYDKPIRFAPGMEKRILDEVTRQLPAAYRAPAANDKTGGTRPLSPAESMAQMRLRDGLRVELVAAEPLVVDPVAIDFGPDGKLWVAEMRDYPEGMDGKYQPGGKIKYLEDIDGDGRFDKSTEFMSDVPFPTGVLAWRRGVLVCAAPDVIFAEDTDGDGKADVRKKLISGFETTNYQARVNGLSLGLDNWIYASAGLFGGDGILPSGKSVSVRNRDFRWLVDQGTIEPVTGRSQQSRVRDDWGNWFGCDNGTPLFHYPVVERYLARNPHIASPNPIDAVVSGNQLYPRGKLVTFAQTGAPGRPTSACGLGIYRDTRLGQEFYGDAFICEPVNQLVHRMKLAPRGVSFAASRAAGEEQSEFLASTDNWFRPVQVRTGPDGAIWVVDMYRYLIEHPRFLSPEVRASLDVRAGDTRGRIYRIVPQDGLAPSIPKLVDLDIAGLVALLKSTNGTLRDMAHLELLWRADAGAGGPLRRLATSADLPQSRAQAVAVLEGLHSLMPDDVQRALADSHPEVRRQAIRLAEPFLGRSPQILSALQRLADDKDAFVRQQLAWSLGESNSPEVGETLAAILLASRGDSFTTSAALSSLNQQNVGVALATLLRSEAAGAEGELVPQVLKLAVAMGEKDVINSALSQILSPKDGAYTARQFTATPSMLEALARRKLSLNVGQADALAKMLSKARALVADDRADESLRLAAADVLAVADGDARREHFAAMRRWLGPQSPPRLQAKAIGFFATVDSAEAAQVLVESWKQLSPALQTTLLDAALAREKTTAALLSALESKSIPTGPIDAARRQFLLTHRNRQLQARAARLFVRSSSAEVAAVVETYRAADAAKGSVALGKALFGKKCASCHKLDGIGHAVGPDLAALTDRSKEYMLASILNPNDAIDQRYASYTAVTAGGEVFSGLLAAEVGNSLTLKLPEGKERTILRSDLDELRNAGVSMMPAGMEKEISLAGMSDLLAYLGASTSAATYRYSGPIVASTQYPDDAKQPKLTNGRVGSGRFNDGEWVGFQTLGATARPQPRIDFDLGRQMRLRGVRLSYGVNHRPGGIHAPDLVSLRTSENGRTFADPVEFAKFDDSPDGLSTYQIARREVSIPLPDLTARYVQLDVRNDGEWTMLSEIVFDGQPLEAVSTKPVDGPSRVRPPALSTPSVKAIDELLAGVKIGTDDEYRVIPQVFAQAIAAGKRNNDAELIALLDYALPKEQEPLRDWQAVAIGGGVINGLSQAGAWPAQTIAAMILDDAALSARWQRSLTLAAAMADNDAVRSGTRYDALRMVAMLPWDRSREQLPRYLSSGKEGDLVQGAVSGLADVPHIEAISQLLAATPKVSADMRALAIQGAARTDDGMVLILEKLETKKLSPTFLTDPVRRQLLNHTRADISARAAKLLMP